MCLGRRGRKVEFYEKHLSTYRENRERDRERLVREVGGKSRENNVSGGEGKGGVVNSKSYRKMNLVKNPNRTEKFGLIVGNPG